MSKRNTPNSNKLSSWTSRLSRNYTVYTLFWNVHVHVRSSTHNTVY